MLRIISCVFIGRYFSQLATKHGKNRWVSGILAGVSTLVLQLLVELILVLFFIDAITSGTGMGAAFVISLIGMALGTVIMLPIYKAFKKSWERNPIESSELLDK